MEEKLILITGAGGFVGRNTVFHLTKNKIHVKTLVRKKNQLFKDEHIEQIIWKDIFDRDNNWDELLLNVDIVIHLIAKTHDLIDSSIENLEDFKKTNELITEKFLTESIARKVKKFIFISSVKVNGEFTLGDVKFGPDDQVKPNTFYGITKFHAENRIIELCKNSSMSYVIIRCPLVYGPGVKANFENLINLHRFNFPIPASGLKNHKRSFVGINNLVDFILLCCSNPRANNQKFMISDNQDVSSFELIYKIGLAMNKKTKYFFLPKIILFPILAFIFGRAAANRFYDNLVVDISKNSRLLKWKPPFSLEENLFFLNSKITNKNKDA